VQSSTDQLRTALDRIRAKRLPQPDGTGGDPAPPQPDGNGPGDPEPSGPH
jgi:hypothetical protein